MARARNIKPGFFTNADLIECAPLARLLFVGLWCEADRRGILEDRPKTLKVKVLPGDTCDVEALLAELEAHGFIKRYEASGIHCIRIENFEKHQNPHRDEKASTLPIPCQHSANTIQAPEQHPTNPADSLLPITDSLSTDSGLPIERATAPKAKRATPLPEDFSVTDDMTNWALAKKFTFAQIEEETERFQNHAIATGRTQVDWTRAWMNWLTSPYAKTNGTPNGHGQRGPDADFFANKARDLERQGR